MAAAHSIETICGAIGQMLQAGMRQHDLNVIMLTCAEREVPVIAQQALSGPSRL